MSLDQHGLPGFLDFPENAFVLFNRVTKNVEEDSGVCGTRDDSGVKHLFLGIGIQLAEINDEFDRVVTHLEKVGIMPFYGIV